MNGPFMLRVVLGVVLVLSLNSGLCLIYFWAETPSSWTLSTEAQLRAQPDLHFEYLILGDSHAKCGVDPRLLPDAFNLATLGSHYHHTYYRLKHFFEREGGTARTVILPMDTHSLAWQRGRTEDGGYWARYLDYPQLAWRAGSLLPYARQYLTDYWLPYAGHGDRMVEALLGTDRRETRFPLHDGFVKMSGSWAETPEAARRALTQQRCAFVHDDYRVPDAVMLQYFRDTLALCDRHGARVVLVRYPQTQASWSELAMHLDVSAIDTVYSEALEAHPHTAHINLGEALGNRLELFNDPDHLNAEGARVFTEMLMQRLAELGT